VILSLLCDADWRTRLGLIFGICRPSPPSLPSDGAQISSNLLARVISPKKTSCSLSRSRLKHSKSDHSLVPFPLITGRLWGVDDGSVLSSRELAERREELQTLAESLAAAAFIKLGKDVDDGLTREEFLNWAMERFKESKTVASPESLHQIFS
jgi:hypothetical protein